MKHKDKKVEFAKKTVTKSRKQMDKVTPEQRERLERLARKVMAGKPRYL